MDAYPESSQRVERQQKHQTKQKSDLDAIKEEQININEISKRKCDSKYPSPPKKDQNADSGSHVWKFFKEIKEDGIKKTQCTKGDTLL